MRTLIIPSPLKFLAGSSRLGYCAAHPVTQPQPITISGPGFTPHSTLKFSDGVTTYYDRVPTYIDDHALWYNIRVGDKTADWTVTVVNGPKRSNRLAFHVTASDAHGAPAAPTGLTASCYRGVGQNSYSLTWTDPQDESGIARVWCKIGAAPSSSTDATALDADVAEPLWVVSPSSFAQTIWVWLEDGAGNRSQANAATLVLEHDPLLPHLDINGPTNLPWLDTSSSVVTLSGLVSDKERGERSRA